MADQQLEDLGTLSAGTIAADDAFLVNDDSDTTSDAGGEPKTITFRHLRAALGVSDLSTFTGRLTLESGKYLSTTDQAAKSTIYLTGPEGGNVRTWLYDGSNWNVFSFAEISLVLSGLTSGKPYDVFLYDSSGTPTLELLVWTNDTTRATALSTQDGVVVKSGSATRRYVGTIYTSGTTTTEDTLAKRYVWNYYNRRHRELYVVDITSHTYTTGSWRQYRASAANQIDFVCGEPSAFVVSCLACMTASPAQTLGFVSVYVDGASTSWNLLAYAGVIGGYGTDFRSAVAMSESVVAGRHYVTIMQYGLSGVTFQEAVITGRTEQ